MLHITNTAFCKTHIYELQIIGILFRWCLVVACFDRYSLTSDSACLRKLAKI